MTAPREVIVRGAATGFAQTIEVDGARFVADEPTDVGGTNSGPTPYDLLLGALGSCTSMTIGFYARRKKWPLDDVTVRLSHARVHEADCERCDQHAERLDHISMTIDLHGALSEEQRAKLIEVAGRCPVHKTLTSKIQITTSTRSSDA
jgi:uncharacterized OsmC-like protein